MGKPWAKYEIGYIHHDKFKALNANAICLWWEGKNYADGKHTDGLLPAYVVKLFRFYSKKSVELLMRSVGPKTATETYAPLWESHDLGWKMHDYLEHNDCRETVLARIDKAVVEQERKRKNQQEWRDRQKDERNRLRNHENDHERNRVTAALPDKQKQQQNQKQNSESERTTERPLTARSNRPIFPGQRVKVFEWMFDDLVGLLGPYVNDFDLHGWFDDLDRRCLADNIVPPPRDGGAWLQHECLLEAQRRGLPLKVASVEASHDEQVAALIRKGPSVRG